MCFVSISSITKSYFQKLLYQNELGMFVLANYLNRLKEFDILCKCGETWPFQISEKGHFVV